MTATISRSTPASEPSVRPAPRREPPFDDEVSGAQLHLAGPWDRPLPFVDARRARAPIAPTRLPCALPDPVAWGRRLLIGIIETAGGRRPLQQLAALLSPRVAYGLGADFERAAALNTRHWTHAAIVRSIHACVPAEGVAELNATVQAGRRVRAVAFRLEAHEGRWRCTKLQLG